MDFDEAIKAHSSWKLKLTNYLKKPDGTLNAADIKPDNKCALGQWIHGDGKTWSTLPEYATLKSEHAKFHEAAADIVKKANEGQSVSADIALGAKSAFALASGAVVTAIMKMRQKAG